MPRRILTPKTDSKEVENLNKPVTSKEIELVIKKASHKEKPMPRWLQW